MRFSRLSRKGRSRAAAIMLALWALFLLSGMIISWTLDINTRLTISGSANRLLEAEAMACSGAEVAMHPAAKPGIAALRGSFPPNQSYEAHITGEAGRLNINRIAAAAMADPNSPQRELLRKYLEVKGIDLNERDRMIDTLLDWIDPDNLVRLNGAENDSDYKPANKFLGALEDLKRVRGWEDFTSRPDWDADFTLATQQPTVDVNWASRDVLLALPGMTEGVVDRFISTRRGPDNIEGTEDDVRFTNAGPGGDVQIALGLTQSQIALIAPLISATPTDQIVRIVSIGKSGGVTRTVRMVVMKPGPRLISWKEY
jgi:general secretion pathway protein K